MWRNSVGARTAAGVIGVVVGVTSAVALEEPKGEKDALKACEKRLCDLVIRKTPATGDFTCGLTKTWAKADLKRGSASGSMSWSFGDARCSVDLKLARATIVSALQDRKATVQFPAHAVNCVIERDDAPTNVTAVLEPKAQLEDGKVKRVWVNLKTVEGPSVIKGLAYTVAKLEDNLGIFRKPLVKAINKLLHEKCPTVATGG
jgi:hypothetical protein